MLCVKGARSCSGVWGLDPVGLEFNGGLGLSSGLVRATAKCLSAVWGLSWDSLCWNEVLGYVVFVVLRVWAQDII